MKWAAGWSWLEVPGPSLRPFQHLLRQGRTRMSAAGDLDPQAGRPSVAVTSCRSVECSFRSIGGTDEVSPAGPLGHRALH